MSIRKRKIRITKYIIAGIICFWAGFFCIGVLGNRLLDIPVRYSEDGVRYMVSTSRFQPAALFTAGGCFFLTLSTLIFFIIIGVLFHDRYSRFEPLSGSGLLSAALMATNLNFFTSRYFSSMAEVKLRSSKLEDRLIRYEVFNNYMGEAFFVLLIILLWHNVKRDEKKGHTGWFGIVVSLLAIAQAVMGIANRTFTVKWLWLVDAAAMLIFLAAFLILSGKSFGGLAGTTSDDGVETIAFFVSDHGFGHMMRTVPVMAELLKRENTRIVAVCGAKQNEMAKEYIRNYSSLPLDKAEERFMTYDLHTDLGLFVEKDSLKLDRERLFREAKAYFLDRTMKEGEKEYRTEYERMAEKARTIIMENSVDKLVSDICPWALDAAESLGVESVLMLSFTWLEIYEEYLPEEMLAPLRNSYDKADHHIFYALCNEVTKRRFGWKKEEEAGYAAREVSWGKAYAVKERLGNERPIVMITVGRSNSGVGAPVNAVSLPYSFITTSGVELYGTNVYRLPENCPDTQNYVAASDYCIIKSGWTTVSECMIAGKPMGLIARDDVAEDRMTIEMLERMNCGMKIDALELEDLAAVIEKMRIKQWNCRPQRNNAREIAERIYCV